MGLSNIHNNINKIIKYFISLMEKQIKRFTYLKERKIWERLDVLPFIVIHSLCMIVYTSETIHYLLKTVLAAVIVLAQALVFFSKFWSENLRARICYKNVNSIVLASHIRVDVKSEKYKMNNRTSICPVIRTQENDLITIEFEKIIYIYNGETFIKNRLPFLKKKVGELRESKPYSDMKEINTQRVKFGYNTMKIPIPSFFSLYKEHIVAPFFVFQLFCIMLWVFDDYGLHSGMTLIMLCIFEATVVGQRIINLVTLRKMRVPPHKIFAYRNEQWTQIVSSQLLPGDIVSVLDGSTYETAEERPEEESSNLILTFLNKMKELKKKAEEQRMQRSINTVIQRHKDKDPSPLTCDMVLLSGSAIVNEAMLTGESVPQIKDSINKLEYEFQNNFDPKLHHKNSILFAGTKVVKVSTGFDEGEPLPLHVHSQPPNKGAICLVLKTGFSTNQGKLLRTVMYSSERTTGDSKEAFVFIFFLLFIALFAAYYVLIEGIEREGEITYKLLLRCIIIITSVVPAELPIELSLAINNSLFFLQGKRIVCIEPFRIPFAGKINFCCFDKTGTLTMDEFIMRGVVKCEDPSEPVSGNVVDEDTSSILIGCNSLLLISGKTVGDPIELAIFKSSGGSIQGTDHSIIHTIKKSRILTIRRYAFDSNLKRMSVLVRFYSGNYTNVQYNRVLSKGAPEVMKSLFKSLPDNYDEVYNSYAKKGYRILALGYADSLTFTINTRREDAEKDLTFCGFVIVETPLKKDTNKYIQELKEADYQIAIITGDHHLTTAKVAQDMKIGPDQILFMKVDEKNKNLAWVDLDGKVISKSTTIEEIRNLSKNYTLGLTGKEMEKLDESHHSIIQHKYLIFPSIKLYCRVSPMQKDDIIKNLIKSGDQPSMCGDGSNDVGALKRAVIGIALLNSEETPQEKDKPFSILSLDDDTTIKSGDVTAAAPFTSKSGSIKCIKSIFIQGRCTLVITFQMFKILALNCLLSAYSLSVLALKGVKFSDYQSTYMGFVVAFFFLMLSKAEPLKKLNKNRPPYTIFSLASIISIIGQAVTNLVSLYLIINITEQYDPINISTVKSLDDPFSPTLMNTIIFIFSALNQTINFVVNYQGEPFMENMTKNKWLVRLVSGVCILSAIVIFDMHPGLNEQLELLPVPEDMNYKLSFIGIMSANFVICYLFENWKKLFNIYK
jgi:cation-transporting ATPase 13A1